MWIFLNDAMFSIVQDKDYEQLLLVRARLDGDIETVFPEAEVFEMDNSDYRFRAFIPRSRVRDAIAQEVNRIDYTNFKDSINTDDKDRKTAYMNVWRDMYMAQMKEEYGVENFTDLYRRGLWV